jgi:hypothetical protein
MLIRDFRVFHYLKVIQKFQILKNALKRANFKKPFFLCMRFYTD